MNIVEAMTAADMIFLGCAMLAASVLVLDMPNVPQRMIQLRDQLRNTDPED